MALIFAVVFGALGFGIYFLYEKFLITDTSSQGFGDLSAAPQSDSHDAYNAQQQKKGQAVDIVIQDEDLPADTNAGKFYVGSNRFMLNTEDVGAGAKSAAKKDSAQNQSNPPASDVTASVRNENKAASMGSGNINQIDENVSSPGESSNEKQFVPVRNLETLYNASGKEAVTKNDVASESQAEKPANSNASNGGGQSFTAADEQLDTLPDLDDVGLFESGGGDSSYYSGEAAINDESDFATGGVRRNAEPPEVKDAELMAKAISTILTNEQ